MKTLLVVGSAPCLFEDTAKALQLRPFASLMLVNGACTAYETAEHVLAGHEEKAEFFARARRERFPNAPPWRLHATAHTHRQKLCREMFPSVTDWHPNECGVAATSASKAVKIGFLLGYDEAILCGCPMNGSGYFPGEADVPQHVNCLRIGDSGMAYGMQIPVQEARIIKGYREKLKILADTEFKGRVFSMSGYSREVLGAPPEFRR